jgi:hypothetical protein
MLLATVFSASGNKKNGIAIQIKPKTKSLDRCSRAIFALDPGMKNNATMPKNERPKGTKVFGASRIMMSINKNDEPQVSAMPRAKSHSIKPKLRFVSALVAPEEFAE